MEKRVQILFQLLKCKHFLVSLGLDDRKLNTRDAPIMVFATDRQSSMQNIGQYRLFVVYRLYSSCVEVQQYYDSLTAL